jgi:PAS domain-containing protein
MRLFNAEPCRFEGPERSGAPEPAVDVFHDGHRLTDRPEKWGNAFAATLALHAIIENFPGGISIMDSSLRIVKHNATFRCLLDLPEHLFQSGPARLEDIFWFNARRGEDGAGDPAELVAQRMVLAR